MTFVPRSRAARAIRHPNSGRNPGRRSRGMISMPDASSSAAQAPGSSRVHTARRNRSRRRWQSCTTRRSVPPSPEGQHHLKDAGGGRVHQAVPRARREAAADGHHDHCTGGRADVGASAGIRRQAMELLPASVPAIEGGQECEGHPREIVQRRLERSFHPPGTPPSTPAGNSGRSTAESRSSVGRPRSARQAPDSKRGPDRRSRRASPTRRRR